METIRKLAAKVTELINLKGWWRMVIGTVIGEAFAQGYQRLERFNPGLAREFVELAEAYLQADAAGMIDEGAELLAAIVKLVVLKRSVRYSMTAVMFNIRNKEK
jgi:NTP pyrophosphatase (non-canonical NTP hydrolase)